MESQPLHLNLAAVAAVMCGGILGAAAREAVEQAVRSAGDGFPTGTFVINLSGAFALGLLLEALVRSGDDAGWRRTARLLGGTGFCGAFTTYSTLAVETVQLARHGLWSTAGIYVGASLVGGLMVAVAGIVVGATHARWTTAALPVDPDVDRAGGRR
ncbi:MAG TPA: CrcB family protein [Acidimicrobiales bacterium]|nr:CrcB family protein [Acidimicrobiales bacterium]